MPVVFTSASTSVLLFLTAVMLHYLSVRWRALTPTLHITASS